MVCSAIDNYTGEKVAIKKINNVFEHVSDATRILREIKLLRLLKHPGGRGGLVVLLLLLLLPAQELVCELLGTYPILKGLAYMLGRTDHLMAGMHSCLGGSA